MKIKNMILFISVFCILSVLFLHLKAGAIDEISDLVLELHYTDRDGQLCDSFYAGEDKHIDINDLPPYWPKLSEGRGNFIWYRCFTEDDNMVFYYYPKVIVTVPQDWFWKDMPLSDKGGGAFNALPSSNTLKKELIDSFYGNTSAACSINIEIKDFKDKEDLERVQNAYEDYTRSGKTIGDLKGDKYTNYSKDIFPSIDVEDTVYIVYSEWYIYKITVEKQFDNRFKVDDIPVTKEIDEIIESMVFIEK